MNKELDIEESSIKWCQKKENMVYREICANSHHMLCNCRGPVSNDIMRQSSIHYQSPFWILSTLYPLKNRWIYLEGWGQGLGCILQQVRKYKFQIQFCKFPHKKEGNYRTPNQCLHYYPWRTTLNIALTQVLMKSIL